MNIINEWELYTYPIMNQTKPKIYGYQVVPALSLSDNAEIVNRMNEHSRKLAALELRKKELEVAILEKKLQEKK